MGRINSLQLLLASSLLVAFLVACSGSSNDGDAETEDFPAICEMARDGDLEGVRSLLEAGVAVESRDTEQDGMTPLMWAAATGQIAVMQELIKYGAEINAVSSTGRHTAMMTAAQRGQDAAAEMLLEAGARVDLSCIHGDTALHHATGSGSEQITQRLLDAGADPNHASHDGTTPLMYAAGRENGPDLISLLLAAGSDATVINKDGETALHFAAHRGVGAAVGLLVDAGLRHLIDVRDQARGETALHRALFSGNLYSGNDSAAAAMIEAGAKLDTETKSGDTPLMYATRFNESAEIVRRIVTAGTDVDLDHQNKEGETALRLAANNPFEATNLEILLEAGADPNILDRHGISALELSLSAKNAKAVELLVRYGADTTGTSSKGRPLSELIRELNGGTNSGDGAP